jgi:hypothetical protein
MMPKQILNFIAALTFAMTTTAWSQSMTDTYTKPEGWKTWCVGRFLIDLPPTAHYAGGRSKYDFRDIETSKDAFAPFMQRIDKVEQELRAQKHKTEPSMIKELIKFDEKGSRGFIYFTFPDYGDSLKSEAFLWKRTGFIFKGNVSIDRVSVASGRMKALAQNLRYRAPNEIPEGPGFCIDKGFISDDGEKYESLMVSFQWSDKPDITLSIMMSTNGDKVDTDTLLSRRPGALSMLGAAASRVQNLREGQKNLREQLGEEWLVKAPNAGGHPAHLFAWEGNGKPNSSASPDIRIDFHTAERDQNGNELSSSLTDKQALALWDQILASLRPRPTGPAKTSNASPDAPTSPHLPLGTRITSAANCPQSGMWECAPDAPGISEHRRFIEAGQPMPYGVVQRRAKGVGGLVGGQEVKSAELVWTLAKYEKGAS